MIDSKHGCPLLQVNQSSLPIAVLKGQGIGLAGILDEVTH